MPDSAYYRNRAELYRQAAALIADPCLAEELREIARRYSVEADRLRTAPKPEPGNPP